MIFGLNLILQICNPQTQKKRQKKIEAHKGKKEKITKRERTLRYLQYFNEGRRRKEISEREREK